MPTYKDQIAKSLNKAYQTMFPVNPSCPAMSKIDVPENTKNHQQSSLEVRRLQEIQYQHLPTQSSSVICQNPYIANGYSILPRK